PPDDVERAGILAKFYGRAVRPEEAQVLQGTGASDGTGDGPARIVRGHDDFRRVRPGDVVVTTTTTPAWTPLFPSLAGLVTETGGILSHAAIVAREYGLPTVVGAHAATRVVLDGVRIHIDGGTGEIRILGPGNGGPGAG